MENFQFRDKGNFLILHHESVFHLKNQFQMHIAAPIVWIMILYNLIVFPLRFFRITSYRVP